MVTPSTLDQMVCFQLYAASRAMTAVYRPLLEPHGLTYPQLLVLVALWDHGPTTVRDLGTRLKLDSGTLSPLIKRLETAGHVRRDRGNSDERTVVVSLTESGLRLRDQLAGLPEQIACAVDLTVDEFHQLIHLLSRIPQKGTTA
ncbi:MarR family transcriptional regulator [Actinoplanes bogorensis]|uniref:MarR family transcriptional regulator n=1 Tax=Paractinoplanes bogorensis TaxID=1610840 RepID=A0ABS5YPZ9_9ACTN|nr:MarR family transcriptional regulator [Actinoplanes bogorensis]MBU2665529.1 MarR family transcriptional regulator [Actinoplanes bogorensis]